MYKTYCTFSINEFSFHSGYGKIGGYVDGHVIENSVYSLLINPEFLSPNSVLVSPNSVLVSPNSVLVSPNSVLVSPNSVLVSPNSVLVSPNSVLVSPNSSFLSPNSNWTTPNSNHFIKFLTTKSITDNCADYTAGNIYFNSPKKTVPEVNHQYILPNNFLQGRHLNQVLIKIKMYE